MALSGYDIFGGSDNADFEVNDPSENDGLKIKYSGGQEGYQLTVDITCNKDQDFFGASLNAATNSAIVASF